MSGGVAGAARIPERVMKHLESLVQSEAVAASDGTGPPGGGGQEDRLNLVA